MKTGKRKKGAFVRKKLWPFLVSFSGAVVMALAFFIPSVQDQWDRYQSRKIIDQYEEVGNDLFDEGQYKMAEDAYAKAYELSQDSRLDIEVRRLTAKVHRISENPAWDSKLPDELEEVDFQFLLHLQKGKDKKEDRVSTLNCYGVFLAKHKRLKESKAAFEEALQLNPTAAVVHINLGNLYDEEGKKAEAEQEYRKGLAADPENAWGHYNLGLLYVENKKLREAEEEFNKVRQLEPADSDALIQYNLVRAALEEERAAAKK